jgi:hypothetical protein
VRLKKLIDERNSAFVITMDRSKCCGSWIRLITCWKVDASPTSGTNCLGMLSRENRPQPGSGAAAHDHSNDLMTRHPGFYLVLFTRLDWQFHCTYG